VAVVVGLAISLGATMAVIAVLGHARSMVALGIVVGDLLLVATVIGFAIRGTERLGAATLGIRRTSWGPAIGWGAAVLFAAYAVDGLLAGLFGVGGHRHYHHFAAGIAVLITLGVAVTAPLAEEITFRGFLFPALTRWRGPWLAAAITGLLFGAAHVAALPAALLPGVAFFGFGACLLFWFTGSLLPGVAVHSLNNAVALAAISRGQLAPAILAAPLICLLVLRPFARERAPAA
jgi:membrane protease YdiL (CAAX protease family)